MKRSLLRFWKSKRNLKDRWRLLRERVLDNLWGKKRQLKAKIQMCENQEIISVEDQINPVYKTDRGKARQELLICKYLTLEWLKSQIKQKSKTKNSFKTQKNDSVLFKIQNLIPRWILLQAKIIALNLSEINPKPKNFNRSQRKFQNANRI